MIACPSSVSVIDIGMETRKLYAFKRCLIKVSCANKNPMFLAILFSTARIFNIFNNTPKNYGIFPFNCFIRNT